MNINIQVRQKIAQAMQDPEIVCGNADYSVHFDFDSEWAPYQEKTARFAFVADGKPQFFDVIFDGDNVKIPAVYRTGELLIGVYAGDIRTTTPAAVPCLPCITDGQPHHPDPPDDVYAQLLYLLTHMPGGDGGAFIRPDIHGGSLISLSVCGRFTEAE